MGVWDVLVGGGDLSSAPPILAFEGTEFAAAPNGSAYSAPKEIVGFDVSGLVSQYSVIYTERNKQEQYTFSSEYITGEWVRFPFAGRVATRISNMTIGEGATVSVKSRKAPSEYPTRQLVYEGFPEDDEVIVIDNSTRDVLLKDEAWVKITAGPEATIAYNLLTVDAITHSDVTTIAVPPGLNVTLTLEGREIVMNNVTFGGSMGFVSDLPVNPPAGMRIVPGTAKSNGFDLIDTTRHVGPISVNTQYDPGTLSPPQQQALRLYHQSATRGWEDVTTSVDVANRRISGTTADLSPFSVFIATADLPLDEQPAVTNLSFDDGPDRKLFTDQAGRLFIAGEGRGPVASSTAPFLNLFSLISSETPLKHVFPGPLVI